MTNKLESTVQAEVRLAATDHNLILWRNNVGKGIVGNHPYKFIKRTQVVKVNAGDAVIRNARLIDFGLFKGSSDLIGLKSVVITQEMVGQVVGIFTGLECKSKTGRQSPEQKTFEKQVNEAGGSCKVVRSVGDMP
jgi:hypothetical protein